MAKARCKTCYWLNWDFLTDTHVAGEPFCGEHGRAPVDPDGEQRNLDNRGGCGYYPKKRYYQTTLFDLWEEV